MKRRGSTGILPVDVLKETRVETPVLQSISHEFRFIQSRAQFTNHRPDFDVHAIRANSRSSSRNPRQAAGLSRQRRHHAKAAERHRHDQSLLHATKRQHPSRRVRASQIATDLYEEARSKIQRFINAAQSREIIFTRGTSEGINLVAASLAARGLKAGDEVIISAMEHHSNIVPWQIVCEQTGAKLRVIPMNDRGELLLDEYEKMLNERTKIVSFVHRLQFTGHDQPCKGNDPHGAAEVGAAC